MKTGRFRIRKTGLLHGQNGAARSIIENRQDDHAFMPALTSLAIMPGPAELHRLTFRYRKHLTGHAMRTCLSLDHHRGPEPCSGEIKIMFAKGDAARPPPERQIFRPCHKEKGPVRGQAQGFLNCQIGSGHRHLADVRSCNRDMMNQIKMPPKMTKP
uniref:Uncharacterized protein n=1 Tax=uncultured bacterium MedeBAC46A06 TaxID=332275 RepID=Q4PJB8_9BACT|nr:hypothetical protein [uncultured bacterium MedeBAC46A06]